MGKGLKNVVMGKGLKSVFIEKGLTNVVMGKGIGIMKIVIFFYFFPDIETPSSTKSADAMSYIRNLHVIDNQRLLTQLSHKLEPRKT